jgi:hypothetical protein
MVNSCGSIWVAGWRSTRAITHITRPGGDPELSEHTKKFREIRNMVQQDRALRNAAIRYIESDFSGFLWRAVLKFERFWRPWPYAESYAGGLFVLAALFSFVPVLAFAWYYLLIRGIPQFRLLAPLLMFGGYFTLVHMVFVGSIRYRILLEPFLIVLGAAGLADALSRLPIG